MKRGDANFNPTEPPEIMADPKEPSDIPEPQGKFEEPKPPAEEVENEKDDPILNEPNLTDSIANFRRMNKLEKNSNVKIKSF